MVVMVVLVFGVGGFNSAYAGEVSPINTCKCPLNSGMT